MSSIGFLVVVAAAFLTGWFCGTHLEGQATVDERAAKRRHPSSVAKKRR
jgi:hypothetical protein